MTQVTSSSSVPLAPRVQRDRGLFSAIVAGLASTIGAGLFVGIGIGAGIAGPAVLFAIALAAVVAICNGLTSAQLMASQTGRRSAGDFGHRLFQPYVDFFSGWTFLFAKAAAAATVSLSISGYALNAFDNNEILWRIGIGLATIVLLTSAILSSFRFTVWSTTISVIVAVGSLAFFCINGYPGVLERGQHNLLPFFIPPSFGTSPLRSIFHASALLILAYAGVERITTLQSELRQPNRIVPRAITIALLFTMALFLAVAVIAIGNSGAEAFAAATFGTAAPLAAIADDTISGGAALFVTVGAVIAMIGVLYHLILGLSRTMLAMGRRKHMPNFVAKVDKSRNTPERAVLASVVLIAILVLIGDIRTTWSFGTFTALIYYAFNNLTALQTIQEERIVPSYVHMAGLLSCLFLAFWVEPVIWTTGLAILFAGIGWRWLMHRI